MTLRIFISGLILLAAAVFLWGGLGIDPESLEYALSGSAYEFAGFSLIPYLAALVLGLGSAAVLLFALKPRYKLPRMSKNMLWGLGIFSSTLFSPRIPLTGFEGVISAVIIVLQNILAVFGLVLTASFAGQVLENKTFPALKTERRSPWLLPGLAVGYALLIYAISHIVFGAIPHIGDEQIQLWGAKIMASGHFTVPIPQNIEFFFDPFMVMKEGRWLTQYPAGFQMLLTPFALVGRPEALNPILTGLTLIVFVKMCVELNLSKWWGLLFALSPFVIFMSASQMNHPAAMFLGALGLYAFIKSDRSQAGWLFL